MSTQKKYIPSNEASLPYGRYKRKGFVRTNDEAMTDEHKKGKSGKGHLGKTRDK